MAPIITFNSCIQLRQLVHQQLDNNFNDNALLLASRLHALEPRNPDAVHTLALCHLRLNDLKAVYDSSRLVAIKGLHLGCSFVFAQACLQLQRYTDGISSIERTRPLWDGKEASSRYADAGRFAPDAAAVNALLGKLYQANGETRRAAECFASALKLNPFMWDVFQSLCDSGTSIRPQKVFRATPEVQSFWSSLGIGNTKPSDCEQGEQYGGPLQAYSVPHFQNLGTPMTEIADPIGHHAEPPVALGTGNMLSRLNINAPITHELDNHEDDMETTPSQNHGNGSISATGATGPQLVPPNAPLRKPRSGIPGSSEASYASSKLQPIQGRVRPKEPSTGTSATDNNRNVTSANTHKRTLSGSAPSAAPMRGESSTLPQQRRSARLLKGPWTSQDATGPSGELQSREGRDLKKSRPPSSRSRSTASSAASGRVVSGTRKPGETSKAQENRVTSSSADASARSQQTSVARDLERESLQWLLQIFNALGSGYYALSQYRTEDALAAFNNLTAAQKETPWVLALIGRAQYEKHSYIEAEKTFARIHKMAPSRLKDMEIYSTILWHLKRDTELAFLSHELVTIDRLSPQAWCCIGNSFSLQRDHDQALRCFKRATQIDPNFAYAWTLQGHEHLENEEFDKAQSAYRKAVGADRRQYNGWYGLGKVYEKLGKYEMARNHYGFAASINPTNAILTCCIGMVLERLKKYPEAYAQYDRALELAPASSISRFKRARVLLYLRKPQEALSDLHILKDMCPDESNVHFMLARTYAMLQEKETALKHYSSALTLDPKALPYIKEAMEALNDEEDGMFDEDDDDTMS